MVTLDYADDFVMYLSSCDHNAIHLKLQYNVVYQLYFNKKNILIMQTKLYMKRKYLLFRKQMIKRINISKCLLPGIFVPQYYFLCSPDKIMPRCKALLRAWKYSCSVNVKWHLIYIMLMNGRLRNCACFSFRLQGYFVIWWDCPTF